MYYVYILRSKNYNKFYTGFTDNLNRRIKEHNSGKSRYTKKYMPWELLFSEQFISKKSAVEKEKYLKSAAGRRSLKLRWGGGTGRHATSRG